MSGLEKAALLLLSIGQEAASRVIHQLDQTTVGRLSAAMAKVKRMEKAEVAAVLDEFLVDLEDDSVKDVNATDYAKRVHSEALGEQAAEQLMQSLANSESMSSAKQMMHDSNPVSLAEQIRTERPQYIALVIAHMEPAAGAKLLLNLPEKTAQEVLYRFARLDSVHPQVLEELTVMLNEQVSELVQPQRVEDVGGSRMTADLLHHMDTELASSFLSDLSQRDSAVADSIRERMFTMEDLLNLDNRSFQKILQNVTPDELAKALRSLSSEAAQKIFSNVSSRAAEALREDLDYGPKIRRADAEAAQKAIVQVARDLDSEGRISIARDEELL